MDLAEYDKERDNGLYGYLRDHQNEHLEIGNLLDQDRIDGYQYKPVGVKIGDSIDPIPAHIVIKYFLRPGEWTLDGYPIVAI